MPAYTPHPMLAMVLNWSIVAAVAALLIRTVARVIITRGGRIGTGIATLMFGGSGAIVSGACALAALSIPKYGPLAMIGWIPTSIILGWLLMTRPRQERQEWLRQELLFMNAMTGGGLIIGSLIAAAVLRYFSFV